MCGARGLRHMSLHSPETFPRGAARLRWPRISLRPALRGGPVYRPLSPAFLLVSHRCTGATLPAPPGGARPSVWARLQLHQGLNVTSPTWPARSWWGGLRKAPGGAGRASLAGKIGRLIPTGAGRRLSVGRVPLTLLEERKQADPVDRWATLCLFCLTLMYMFNNEALRPC